MRQSVIRQRRAFLEQKQAELIHQSINARKHQLRYALETQTPIPGQLKKDALKLKRLVELDDDRTKEGKSSLDDEYALAGISDPKILVTTTREPSQKLLEFTKEVRLTLPNSTRINRGNISVPQVISAARRDQFTDVVVIGASRGIPDTLTISHLPMGPTVTFSLHNIVTRHDVRKTEPELSQMSLKAPHLIFDKFVSPIGLRIRDVLKYLFPVPRHDSSRVVTFDNNNDFISFRHHTFEKSRGDVVLTEVGPRFEMHPFRILLGTLEMADANVEWVYHAYTNTASKRNVL